MEISTWVEQALGSEISGNVIDLCPVGALNSKPYEYRARTWELRKTESVDVLDAVGCNIRVDARGSEVMRILPRLNEDVNEEWISDKARFSYDGLKRRRLDVPMVKTDGKLQPTGWNEAFAAIGARLDGIDGRKVAFIVGDLVDCETMVLVRELAAAAGHAACRLPPGRCEARCRAPRRLPVQHAPSPASTRPTPACWSAPTRAGRRRSSTRGCASAGAPAASRSAGSARSIR